MFSIALSVSVFHALALLGLLAAFALDNARLVKSPAMPLADAVAARQPTDEEILMMVAAPTGARIPSQPQPQSGVARAA
jgi:hypothetical protein